jgi:hypothetical protein
MRKPLVVALSFLGIGLVGCGGSPNLPAMPKDAPTVGPHGGTAFALPDGMGYAEVVNDPPPGERDRSAPTSLVVYFLQPDAKTALSTPPTEVKVQGGTGRNTAQSVALKAEPKADDPAGASRFATPRGAYQLDEFRGELTAKAGSTPVKITIAGAR